MFEGLVRQLLLGYLGRYIKDIQREQLKITLWNEEVLLENVELILEAFDYLRLPFALKQGHVGRLCIKIPWKKLGWDPIIITIEDVFVCACQRDDKEWSMDAVERREFAGKKAKLAAAELAKLSRRVCDNQAGESFISYITAKILDGIQVSIRNVHILYRDMLTDSAQNAFGIKFSTLTIMKQNLLGISSGKMRGQVNKVVEIQGLEIYCSTFQGTLDLVAVDSVGESKLWDNARFEGNKSVYILAPVDVSISLLVCRSGKHENGTPQYSINVDLTGLVLSLNEVQLQQILILWDYLFVCQLREKYGRYRPWNSPLSRKLKGWQKVWWHYAQQSVLSDVRKKLKKTSWKYLGERLNRRRRYVNLYKTKLKCLREELVVDDDILQELEQMEKESDIEDILNYRSTAESELQEFFLNSNSSSGVGADAIALEKSHNEERSSNRSRGWLKWLSYGMLGAGGTDDSSQFSGVVSDEVIKDIYEATEFEPAPSPDGATAMDNVFSSEIKFHINQVSATLWNTNFGQAVVELIFEGMFLECKLSEDSVVIIASINSGRMINPFSKQDILLMGKDIFGEDVLETDKTSVSFQVHISSAGQEVKFLVKAMLKPLEVTFDSEFLLNVMDFYNVLENFKFQHERVMLSLNGIEDVKARLLAKTECILSSRTRVFWDVNFMNIKLNIPGENTNWKAYNMVVDMGALTFVSKQESSPASDIEDQSCVQNNFTSSVPTTDISVEIQLQDLYDYLEIKIDNVAMKLIIPCYPHTVSVLEEFSASVCLTSCIIPDESILKQLEVYIIMSSLNVHFSPSIYGAILGLRPNFVLLHSKSESVILPRVNSLAIMSSEVTTPKSFNFSVIVNFESVSFHICLENDKENGCALLLNLHGLDIRYASNESQECWISVKALKVITYSLEGDKDGHILCTSGNLFPVHYAHNQGEVVEHSEHGCDRHTSVDGCFLLQYVKHRKLDIIFHKYTVCLSDIDFHCYPYIIRLLVEFSDKILQYHTVENSFIPSMDGQNPTPIRGIGLGNFGCSNFYETGSSEWESIPLDRFPFVTICNSGSLSNLESSFLRPSAEWRKILERRDKKIGSPKFSMNGSKMLDASELQSGFGKDAVVASQDVDVADILVDLNLSRIRVHLHDYSCTVGTVIVPSSRSSLSVSGDCLDVLCSTEGLILCSSWWTQNINDFLWGPSLTNLSPILNLRVRKQKNGSSRSQIEISFSCQHVSCTLPPEFLAIVIGYFSLPDWQPGTHNPRSVELENNIVITYKFEILDSILFVPVESDDPRFLKLEIPQFYCSFIDNSSSDDLLKDIPLECLVAKNKIAERNHSLNVFGRDLSLSLLLLNDDGLDSSMVDQNSGHKIVTFIASFSADVWVRIPHENDSSVSSHISTCIMARVHYGQLIAKDGCTFAGFEALLDIIDRFSAVDKEAKGFTSDVPQFLQFKKILKENDAIQPDASPVSFTDTRFCVKSLSINFYCSRSSSVCLDVLARADMQFICAASFQDNILLLLDLSFNLLSLFSQVNSVILAECSSSCPTSSVLDIHFSVSDQGENELHVFLPSMDIWLHLFDWTEFIDLLSSYPGQLAKTFVADLSPKNSVLDPADKIENVSNVAESSPHSLTTSSCFELENLKHNVVLPIVKSENIGINIHIPIWVSREAFSIFRESQIQDILLNESCNMDEGVHDNFLAVTLQSRCSELAFCGGTVKIKSKLEKVSGTMGPCKEKSSLPWPFFQFSEVNVEAEIHQNQLDFAQVNVEIQCDSLDVWLSYHIFYFWRCMWFNFPDAGSDQFTFCTGDLDIKLKKVSLLLTDGRWSSKRPLLEFLTRNLLLHANIAENKLEGYVGGELQANYNNIHKVLWEPFVEPWKFHLNITRADEKSALLKNAIMTDIHLTSTAQLNFNVTESLIEAIFRATEIVKDAWGVLGPEVHSESQRVLNSEICENLHTKRYAPYVLQNLTSLPLIFHVCQGPICVDNIDISVLKDRTFVHPGSSIPIYINETPEEQLLRFRPAHPSDRISDKQLNGVAHHYIIIQFDGISMPSTPISMDLVGLSYFEVDFSKSSNKIEVDNNKNASQRNKHVDEFNHTDSKGGFVIPVVCDVSVQRYCKLIRLYSTVILLNATSIPFELRFDIPFGISPKILDPIYPGQEFPLPLHLAEAGSVRWRPLGQNYLWSEAHNISNILSHESRIGHFRSFVCYPSHPSSDPFRCCISLQYMCFPSAGKPECSALNINRTVKQTVGNCDQISDNMDSSMKRFIHQVTLSCPLVVRNYLPKALSLTMESGGVTRTALLTEVETSFFHIDSSHDLEIGLHMYGYKPSILKFPRAEAFSGIAKFSGTKFSLSEAIPFDPDICDGPLYVTVEKVMDAFSGAREICIFVPYLLYNCTGFSLIISDSTNEMKGHSSIIPSCFDLDEQDLLLGRKDGLGLLSSSQDLNVVALPDYNFRNCYWKNRIISRKSIDPHLGKISRKPISCGSSALYHESSDKRALGAKEVVLSSLKSRSSSSIESNLECSNLEEIDCRKAEACMYSPDPNSFVTEIMVRIRRHLPEGVSENMAESSWSGPFFLVQPTGSTNVLVPQLSKNAAYIISVTSRAVAGPFSGRTRTITFQPRFVISNACSKELCYKQKGTDSVFHLGIGQHSHLQWADTTRELLVSIRFNEPGWQWSGCFLPDHLGDTQVKMRNYVSGVVNMIRVEVQNADVSIQDEKIVGSLHGNFGTNLILLSDDDTGFMPYRIDNFSKERLRVYQQRCETFETIIQSYTSCPYAWDEPCYPHRLAVEVSGERIVGLYTLDNVKDYAPVYLPSTSEKPERTLLVSIHAEGAVKVLSIIDASYHVLDVAKDPHVPQFKEKIKHNHKQESSIGFKEKISISIPFIGISLINSHPQELLFACAKDTRIDLLQSLDQQKFSFQISSLQIDNQLPNTRYPVTLSFDRENRANPMGQIRNIYDNTTSDCMCEPVFCLAAAKWRNRDVSLVSFEYISLRVTDFHLELEQEVILGLFDFFRSISSRSQVGLLTFRDSTLHPSSDLDFLKESPAHCEAHNYVQPDGLQFNPTNKTPFFENSGTGPLPPSVVPIGAPWQKIYLLARRQKKIYVEMFDVAPIKCTLSFSSTPWMLRNGVLTSGEYLIHRALMALADVEGAQIHLKQLIITHHMASWESIQEIIIRHYTRQLLHEMYKVFGSAGVIGNPMGFARSVSLGIKDFLSVPARSVFQSPAGLITGMAQGTTSLLTNTIYAISDAATQFSRAAHKGIVAFTFDDQVFEGMEKQQKGISSHSKGVINELFEGLTGLLQSPIKGAEKHGLLGVVSGVALGVTGLVARPAASILEVTGKTAQSIRNRSKLHHMGPQRLRVRLPRRLSRELGLSPYSWEEAVGMSVLAEADNGRLKDEVLITCKALKQGGKFVVITEKLVLVVGSFSLVDLGKPEFEGVPADPEWVIEAEIEMHGIIHADTSQGVVVHIVGSSSDPLILRQRHNQNLHQQLKRGSGGGGTRGKQQQQSINPPPTLLPLHQTNLEFKCTEEAEELLRVLLFAIEKGKVRGWGRSVHILHQSNLK